MLYQLSYEDVSLEAGQVRVALEVAAPVVAADDDLAGIGEDQLVANPESPVKQSTEASKTITRAGCILSPEEHYIVSEVEWSTLNRLKL